MPFTVTQLLTDLNRKVSPGTTSQSRDIFGVISEGANRLLSAVKPKELSRRAFIENALYDQVLRFTCPEDLDQKNVMQWFQLKDNRNVDTFYYPMLQTTNRRFDQQKGGDRNLFTIEWQSGVKFIKVSNMSGLTGGPASGAGLTIHTMNSITENGTWNVFGNVVNLVTDNLTYVAGNGSLRFNINTSSNTGGIFNTTLEPFSIVDFFTVGKIFTWLDIPNLNQIQTVTLDLFSDNTNLTTDYYSITVNSPHDVSFFQEGQNLMGFPVDEASMNTIGTPNPANIEAIRFTFVTNGTLNMNNIRIDNVVARKGGVFGIQYISEYCFQDVNGLWKARPTIGSDIINLEFQAYNLLLDFCAVVLGQEIFTGTQGLNDLKILDGMLSDDLKKYKKDNKEEFIDEQQQLYNFGVEYGYRNGWSTNRWNNNRP